MKRKVSWRVEWMLFALALVCAGVAHGILPHLAELSALSEGLETKPGGAGGEIFLYVLAVLLGLGFFFRLAWRVYRRRGEKEEEKREIR